MYPSEYIARHGKHRDIHSLENVLGAFRYGGYQGQDWVFALEVLSDPKHLLDESLTEIVFEFLAEIQFAENTLVAWYNRLEAERVGSGAIS